ncbi:MAG TPA: glycosyl hydrolase family 79 C-terminal domain-containing protein [Verrucomicrobiae bacterium]
MNFHPRRFNFRLGALLAALILTGATIGRAQLPVVVQLFPQNPGAEIPADFLGLSFEMQRVLADTNGNHYFSAENKNLIATFKTLGIKNLRVGGNTADRPTLPAPSETDVDNLFAFAKAANLKVIFTLRLNHGEIDAAVKMANYISKKYKNQLDCFAIGNEPNVFSTNYDVYISEWKRFATAITAPTNSPDAKFCGPSVSPGHEKWSARFADDLAASGHLKFISQHDYPGGDARKFTNSPAVAREKILSRAMAEHYAQFAANFVPAVISNGLAFRFEEANSFYDGGARDASDTFAAALWALNYQWWWANHGMSGINFHTGDKVAARDENKPCRYATFWTAANGYNIHPIGYAEKMFSLGSHGKIIPVKISPSENTNLNFTAYAILGGDKKIYVTLINQSHGATATNLSVQIGGYTKGEIIRLTAPDGDVSGKTGVTLGGAEISDNANWNGKWEKVFVSLEKSTFALLVELPAASAAVVKLTPR